MLGFIVFSMHAWSRALGYFCCKYISIINCLKPFTEKLDTAHACMADKLKNHKLPHSQSYTTANSYLII